MKGRSGESVKPVGGGDDMRLLNLKYFILLFNGRSMRAFYINII